MEDYKYDATKDDNEKPGSGIVSNDVERYEIFQDGKGYRFRKVNANAEIVQNDSDLFETKVEAQAAVADIVGDSGIRIDVLE